jgi:flavin-dependent dehydrogenase
MADITTDVLIIGTGPAGSPTAAIRWSPSMRG